MKLPALFRAVAGSPAADEAAPTSGAGASLLEDRRRPVYRCTGCHAWKPPVLVYMSNGGHYCPSCARAVHAWSGAKPVGRRWDDIVSINEDAAVTVSDRPIRPDLLTG